MIRKIHHVGIAVGSLREAVPFFRDVLGREHLSTVEVEERKIRGALFRAGESRIELIEPTAPGGPVGKFLERNGEGLHHVCFQVDDVAEALSRAASKGVRLVDEAPRPGIHGLRVAFLDPKSAFGVLTEFAQEESAREGDDEP